MKAACEVKNSKLYINWEDVKADFYRILVKIDDNYVECTQIKGITFVTLSLLPVGVGECNIQAIRNGLVIAETQPLFFHIEYPDAVCLKNEDDTITVLCSSQEGAQGYRLYKNIDNSFNGVQNFAKNGATFKTDDINCLYKFKPYRIENEEKVFISSSRAVSANDNYFEKLTVYKSYGGKMFLSWNYNGYADGFAVYNSESEYPVFETNDGKMHYAYLSDYKEDALFYVKAFLNTPNGKVIISRSEFVRLSQRKYEKPEVSLIIPAYNAQNYIARSIDSALASDFDNLEIVIVNDGSSDNTQQIIDWYAQNYSNVVSLQKENGGVADTRNVGINAARGKYIAFMDNDDLIRPNMISSLFNSIEKNHCDVAIAPLYRLVDKGYTLHCNLPFEEDKPINIDEYFEILYTPGYYNCAIWNKLYNAQMVKDHPLGILKYEDVSWTPCILSYAENFCFLKTPFYEWDRKTRPETFGDILAKMPEDDLFEHRKQAMMFFVENGNPDKSEILKTIAVRRLMRYSKNSTHNGYRELIEKLS